MLVEDVLDALTATEETEVTTQLSTLSTLEAAIATAATNLDIAEAGPVKRNQNEIEDRKSLYAEYRRKLCSLLGVPPGPGVGGGNTVRLIRG